MTGPGGPAPTHSKHDNTTFMVGKEGTILSMIGAETRRRRQIVLAIVVVLTVFAIPHVVALAIPPPGRTFTGAFALQDDFLQYASFAEQAGRGALVFANKFDPRLQGRFLLNPEWWLAGVLGRLLGSPMRGLQLLSLPSFAFFLAGVVRLLRLARGDGAIVPGLLLVTLGSGLGWADVLRGYPPSEQADLVYLFFPSSHALGLWTHGLVGLGLLCWSFALHLEWRRKQGKPWAWIATAALLGLCRPFDLAVFFAVGLSDRKSTRLNSSHQKISY